MRHLLLLVGLGAMILAGCEAGVLVNNQPEREPNWQTSSPQAAPTAAEPETASGTVSADETGRVRSEPTTRPADQRIETQDITIESYSE